MSDLITTETGGLMSLLHNQNGELAVPKPFEKDIFLFDTHIAGTSYIDGIEELEAHLNEDDKRAIVINTIDGVKIGYVPRYDNAIFSRLMDAGKLLFGRISSKEGSGRWVRINIKVYLHE